MKCADLSYETKTNQGRIQILVNLLCPKRLCWKIIPAAHVGNEEGRQIIESTLSLIESLPLRDTKNMYVDSTIFLHGHEF